MSQTAYAVDPDLGFRGLLGDPNADSYIIPMANGAAAAQGFGILVKRDAVNPTDQFDIFSATGQDPLGVLVHTQAVEDPTLAGDLAVALLETASVLRRGRIWVRVEEAVAPGDSVYFRHTASGGNTELGAFRNDANGVAQVTTLTPTVADDTIYTLNAVVDGVPYNFQVLSGGAGNAQISTCTPTVVEDDIYGLDIDYDGQQFHFEAVADGSAGAVQITTLTPTVTNSVVYGVSVVIDHHLYNFRYTSDGSAADTEIVAGIQAAMAANAEFTALVVATGTTTLILTGQNAGQRFDVADTGVGGAWTSIVETQAPGIETATTLCDKFRALMAADATFTALVVASGTTTLVLTGQAAGGDFQVLSSGHGTWAIVETQAAGEASATTICDGFRTLMAANVAFTADIVATGTTTLILTAQTAGLPFYVNSGGPGLWASITETVAASSTCDLLENAQWLIGSAAAGVALLEINIP